MKTLLALLVFIVAPALVLSMLGGCSGCSDDDGTRAEPLLDVNVQVTGAPNIRPMMEELDRRSIPATVWLSSAELDAECEYVGELAAGGHEIAGKYPTSVVRRPPTRTSGRRWRGSSRRARAAPA